MAYLYFKQRSGELYNENSNIGEFIVHSYTTEPIVTNYIFDDDEEEEIKYEYFANCKLINKLIGKAEKIKKDDPLLINDEVCFICFDKYKEKELKRKLPICNHFFHKKCIDKWLKNKSTCPHCRTDLMTHITLSDEDKKEYHKNCCNCDYNDDEEDDDTIHLVEFNLGVIKISNNNISNVQNNDL